MNKKIEYLQALVQTLITNVQNPKIKAFQKIALCNNVLKTIEEVQEMFINANDLDKTLDCIRLSNDVESLKQDLINHINTKASILN